MLFPRDEETTWDPEEDDRALSEAGAPDELGSPYDDPGIIADSFIEGFLGG